MCGFGAIYGLDGWRPDRARIERMAAAIRHRGPDDDGVFLDDRVALGFRRLSILDLSQEAHQPMVSADGRLVLTFNGEIYNYRELRDDLAALGHRFRSTGDTEVLLHAYQQWGRAVLDRLNGMWAFVVYDRTTGELFGSRDRFGIKPLYVHRADRAVVFASEIKAICASGLYTPELNLGPCADYLHDRRFECGPETWYRGVEEIPPGSWFRLDPAGRLHVTRFWELPGPNGRADGPELPDRFAELFEDAVRLRLRSDVPVGVCLSGGLDSTSIVCAMASQYQAELGVPTGQLHAFSYNAIEYDESGFVADTIAATGVRKIPLLTSPRELWEVFPTVLSFQDEPFQSITPAVGYLLHRLARSHGVPVVLNGQGADETIGGYPTYFLASWREILRHEGVREVGRQLQAYTGVHGGAVMRYAMQVAQSLVFSSLRRIPGYPAAARGRRTRARRQHDWLAADLADAATEPMSLGDGTLDAVLRGSVTVDPLPLYLRVEDRNSMAHSVEVRLPFLDYRLVSFLFGIAASWKLRGPWNKYILREGMRGRIPESVRARVEKMGFPTPFNRWIRHELREPMLDVLTSRAARERGLYDIDRVVTMFEQHQREEIDVADPLFRVAQVELWHDVLGERRQLASEGA